MCRWCLIIASLYMSTLREEDAATRKQKAPEQFVTRLKEVNQPVTDPFSQIFVSSASSHGQINQRVTISSMVNDRT